MIWIMNSLIGVVSEFEMCWIKLNYFGAWCPLKSHTYLNQQLSGAVLFKFVWPFSGQQALKELTPRSFPYLRIFMIKLFTFKGNPNFQGISNWILQILYHYSRKQEIKNQKLTIYWIKCWYLFLPFILITATRAFFASIKGRVFSLL